MKVFFLIIIISTFSFLGYGQVNSCKDLHEGIFKLTTPESGTTEITRNKNTQTELNDVLGVSIIYYVRWIDDCTYELRVKKLLRGDQMYALKKGNVIICKISNFNQHSYTVNTSTNFSDFKIEFEMQIVR